MFAATCGAMSNTGTAELVIFLDKLFDSLNGTAKTKKSLNGPLKDGSPHF